MIDAVNGDLMIGDALVVAMRGATDAAVRVTGLIGTRTEKGIEKERESEGTATAIMTDTVTAIEIESMRETVVDAGVKRMVTRH
jgi:hypothetical protein